MSPIQTAVYTQLEQEASEAYCNYILFRKSNPVLAQQWLDYSLAVDAEACGIYFMPRGEFAQWKFWQANAEREGAKPQVVAYTQQPTSSNQQLALF